jgi:hypothetical protein
MIEAFLITGTIFFIFGIVDIIINIFKQLSNFFTMKYATNHLMNIVDEVLEDMEKDKCTCGKHDKEEE